MRVSIFSKLVRLFGPVWVCVGFLSPRAPGAARQTPDTSKTIDLETICEILFFFLVLSQFCPLLWSFILVLYTSFCIYVTRFLEKAWFQMRSVGFF